MKIVLAMPRRADKMINAGQEGGKIYKGVGGRRKISLGFGKLQKQSKWQLK